MSYVKIGQISDVSGSGLIYTELDSEQVINNNSPSFPLQVNVEVIDWGSQSVHNSRGEIVSYVNKTVTIPNNSLSIRQSVYNQLIGTYPTLVM